MNKNIYIPNIYIPPFLRESEEKRKFASFNSAYCIQTDHYKKPKSKSEQKYAVQEHQNILLKLRFTTTWEKLKQYIPGRRPKKEVSPNLIAIWIN